VEIILSALIIGKVVLLMLQPYTNDSDNRFFATMLSAITLLLTIIVTVMYFSTMHPIGTAFSTNLE
jgi:hypothetical protein